MSVSRHPSVKPAKPHRPPNDRHGQGARKSGEDAPYGAKHEFQGYDHDPEMHSNHYGHACKLHGKPGNQSEIE